MNEPHIVGQLDEVVHQRFRLGILVVLDEVGRVEFTYLRDTLELTDGNLGRHLDVLNDAGHIKITKAHDGRRTRTTVAITHKGRSALEAELAALDELVTRRRGHLRSL